MRTLKELLPKVGGRLGKDKTDRLAARTASVRAMFKDAILHCYHEAAPAVLSHVNAVYIMKEERDGTPWKVLTVYMDDANFRSDVHARQYYLILWLQERYGEVIDEFRSYSARAAMRQRHAFAPDVEASEEREEDVELRPITPGDERTLARWATEIEDPQVRAAFLQAARSGLARWD